MDDGLLQSFHETSFSPKQGINFKWYRSLIELYCLKADTGMQIRVGGEKKPINEYRSGSLYGTLLLGTQESLN